MSVVGEAYIAISPEVDDFGPEIEREVEGSLSGLGNIGKAAGAAVGVAVVAGAMEGIERERLSDRLAAQLDLSPEESERAGAVAGSLYADAYGESLAQVNDAVGAVMSSIEGLSDADTEAVTANALDLASAFDVDVQEAVSVVGTMMRQGLVDDAEAGFDQITSAMQQVPASMRDELLPIMDEYAKDFAGLGLSGEDAMGLIVSASDKGRLALDKTGDAVKEFSIRSTDMSSASTEAYEAIGLNAEDMAERILAGGDTASEAFQQTVDGLLAMENPAERAQAAIALFGTPIEDLGVSGIPDFLEGLQGAEGGLGDFEGAAARMGDTLNDNAATRIEGFRRKVEETLAKVVELPGPLGAAATAVAGTVSAMAPLAPAMTGVAVVFKDQLGGIASSMGSAVGSAVSWAGRTAAAAGRAAAGVARSAGAMIASMVRWAVQSAANAARAVASMAVATGQFIAHYARMAAAAAANAVRMAASWVIAMGPIGWVIAAVVALVALIVANWDTVVEWTRKAWEWVAEKVAAVWEWITGATSDAVDAIVTTVQGWVDTVVGFVTNLYERWLALMGAIRDAVVEAVVGLVTTVVETVSGWVESIVGFVTDLWTRWVALQVAIRDAVIEAVTTLVTTVATTVQGWVESVVGFVTDLWTRWVALVTTIRDRVVELVINLTTTVATTVSGWVESIVGFVTDLWQRWVNLVHTIRDAVIGAVATLVSTVVSTVSGWVSSIVGLVTGLWNRWVGLVTQIRDTVIERVRSLVSTVVSTISGWVRNVVRFVGNLRRDFVRTISNLVRDSIRKVRELPGKILDAVRNFGTLLKNAGRRLITGLVSGITEKIGNIGRAMSDAAAQVTRFWPFSPAKEGPLRDRPPEAAGGNIVSLMAEGMAANIGRVAAQAKAAAEAAIPAMDDSAFDMDAVRPAMARRAGDVRRGAQPAGMAEQAQATAAAVQAAPLVGGDVNIYTTDPKRSGDEVLRTLRERAYLAAPLAGS